MDNIWKKNIKSLAVMAACGAVLIGSGVDVFAKSKVIKESAEVVAENKDQSVNANEVNAAIVRLATVNMVDIESKSKVVIDLLNKLKTLNNTNNEEMQQKANDLQKQVQDLEAKRGVLSAMALEEKRKSLSASFDAFQKESQVRQNKLQDTRASALGEIDMEVRKIIANLAKDKNLNLVIANQISLFVNPSDFTDITPEVIEALNVSMPTIDIAKHSGITRKVAPAKSVKK